MKVVQGAFGKQAPTDLSHQLRELADAVDRGEIVNLIAAYIQGGDYSFLMGASLSQSLELATLMQHRCIYNFTA